MPPVLGPRSPLKARLWSCTAGMWRRVMPSVKREERELFAFELFFDDEGMACGEELVAEGEGFGARGEVVAEDLDAFAAGEAVILDDVIFAEAIEEGFDAVE